MTELIIIIKNLALGVIFVIIASVFMGTCLKYLDVNKDYAIDSILTPLVLALCFYTGAKTAIEIEKESKE